MILLFPTLIDFKSEEDKQNFAPTCHMFYDRRVVDIPDGKPKWSGLNNQSDLIEDSPPDLKRKREEEKRESEEKDAQQEQQ